MAGRRREHGKERLAVVCATSGGDVCDPRVRIAADEVSEVVEAIVGVVLLHDAVAAYIVRCPLAGRSCPRARPTPSSRGAPRGLAPHRLTRRCSGTFPRILSGLPRKQPNSSARLRRTAEQRRASNCSTAPHAHAHTRTRAHTHTHTQRERGMDGWRGRERETHSPHAVGARPASWPPTLAPRARRIRPSRSLRGSGCCAGTSPTCRRNDSGSTPASLRTSS